MRIGGGGSDRSFGIVVPTRGERSPNASERRVAPLNAPAEQPTFADLVGAARPNRPPTRRRAPRRGRRARRSQGRKRSGGLRPGLALPARDVGMHGFMLPAVVPLAVDGESGLAAGLSADPPGGVGLVGSWKVPDGRPPEPVVRHTDSHPFPWAGCGLPALSTHFEQPPRLVHSRGLDAYPFRVTVGRGCDTEVTRSRRTGGRAA